MKDTKYPLHGSVKKLHKFTVSEKCFSSNQFRVKLFSKKLLSRKFCEKMVAAKFRKGSP